MKSILKNLIIGCIIVLVSCVTAVYTTYKFLSGKENVITETVRNVTPDFVVRNTLTAQPFTQGKADFITAAEKSIHAVVHIKSTEKGKTKIIQHAPNIYDFIFGDGTGRKQRVHTQPRVGFGSGVILSEDGYIVTNNHVINGADEINVTLNDNRTFIAELIGSDNNTDLALLKITTDEKLPFLTIGNSDELKVGEWVLAVGNPFNLTSTVTAGIVSAKTRSLGIYNGGIESFIQTDAAINQGNSGGALVNTQGELVGINSVLTSPTGSYAGYGFAIPVSIMTKVVEDLKHFGTVQRAILGIIGVNVNSDLNKKSDLGTVEGVFISKIIEGGAADKAGLETGDVITSIDNKKIKNMAELQETLAKFLPGSKIEIETIRNKKSVTIEVTLENEQGGTNIIKETDIDILGAEFKEIEDSEKELLGINNGVVVTEVNKGIFSTAGIKKGTIILKINSTAINSIDDVKYVLKKAKNSDEPVLFITAQTSNGKKVFYSVPLL
ncbi:MAG: Do family serine endopeptidase [Bacteroidaceae bacterium]|nr:Do family serine endopeptidase [Bacteroidaceae bacterium]